MITVLRLLALAAALSQPKPAGVPAAALVAAGSGTALPAARILLRAYASRAPAFHLEIAESIGSTGAPLAVRAGAAALGLMSRPLKPREADALCELSFAQDLLIVAAAPDVTTPGLTSDELVRVFAGELREWTEDHRPIHVLQREAGDSGSQTFAAHIPALGPALQQALDGRRWLVLFHDAEMQEALQQTPGALGFFDLGALRAQGLKLKVLAINGQAPSPEAFAQGRYPFAKTLAFLLRKGEALPPDLAAFIAFSRSTEGVAALSRNGYLPPPPLDAACP